MNNNQSRLDYEFYFNYPLKEKLDEYLNSEIFRVALDEKSTRKIYLTNLNITGDDLEQINRYFDKVKQVRIEQIKGIKEQFDQNYLFIENNDRYGFQKYVRDTTHSLLSKMIQNFIVNQEALLQCCQDFSPEELQHSINHMLIDIKSINDCVDILRDPRIKINQEGCQTIVDYGKYLDL